MFVPQKCEKISISLTFWQSWLVIPGFFLLSKEKQCITHHGYQQWRPSSSIRKNLTDCFLSSKTAKFEEVSQKEKKPPRLSTKNENISSWHNLTTGIFCSNNFLPMNLFFLRENLQKKHPFVLLAGKLKNTDMVFSWKFSRTNNKNTKVPSDFHPPILWRAMFFCSTTKTSTWKT